RAKYFFGLPGNPVSTMVTFKLFAEPMVAALAGAKPHPLHLLRARLSADLQVKPGLTRFLPARLSGSMDSTEVEVVKWHGSGDVFAQAQANCYLVVGEQGADQAKGELADVLLR